MSRHSVIIVAGGSGHRMNSSIPKQYLELNGKPVLAHALLLFEHSFIDEIILVVRKGDEDYCQKEYVEKYNLKKVAAITAGGEERYLSVYQGIQKVQNTDYIWIHDGARPFITMELLENLKKAVEKEKAVVLGVPVKDTVKQTDERNQVIATIPRQNLWNIQTPQVFSADIIKEAYEKFLMQDTIRREAKNITDDSMVVETMTSYPVTIIEGSYDNIKITTPEDMRNHSR